MVKFAYPAFDEQSDERRKGHEPQTGVEENIDEMYLEGRSRPGHMFLGSNYASFAFGKSGHPV